MMPMRGDQIRNVGGPRSTSPATTTTATVATISAPVGSTSSGTSVSMSNRIGITVAAISIITVPVTTGV